MKEQKVIMSVQLTVEQKKRLTKLAKDQGIGPSTLLRQIVMVWLNKKEIEEAKMLVKLVRAKMKAEKDKPRKS